MLVNALTVVGGLLGGGFLSRMLRHGSKQRHDAVPLDLHPEASPNVDPFESNVRPSTLPSPSAAPAASAPLSRERDQGRMWELQRAIFAEMVRHAQVTSAGSTRLPDKFVVSLHTYDHNLVAPQQRSFNAELVNALTRAASDHGWTIAATRNIDISLREDRTARIGAPTVTASESSRTAESRGGLMLRCVDTNETMALSDKPIIIARDVACNWVFDDPKVSRSHCRIDMRGQGWVLQDLGSANGTFVNGEQLPKDRKCPLRIGDRFALGSVIIHVELHDDEAGRPALSDIERTRISATALPPRRRPEH